MEPNTQDQAKSTTEDPATYIAGHFAFCPEPRWFDLRRISHAIWVDVHGTRWFYRRVEHGR